MKFSDQQTAQLNSTYIQLNAQFCRIVIDFLLIQPDAYSNYERNEKIPLAKHQQLEFYLSDSHDLHQVDRLIQTLFDKCVHILKDNIEKHEDDLQNLSVCFAE